MRYPQCQSSMAIVEFRITSWISDMVNLGAAGLMSGRLAFHVVCVKQGRSFWRYIETYRLLGTLSPVWDYSSVTPVTSSRAIRFIR